MNQNRSVIPSALLNVISNTVPGPDPSVIPSAEHPNLVNVRAARCVYHYLEELALYMYGLNALEREVGHLLLQGFVYQQIAQRMFLSESTIKVDAQRIFAKVRVKDRRAFEQHVHALIESI